MKKEIIISIIVITIVIIGNIVTQNNTKQSVAELNGNLDELKQNLIGIADGEKKMDVDYLRYKEMSTEIRDIWDEMQEVLSFYIEHDELEKVETDFVTCKSYMESKQYDMANAELEKTIFVLEHISDKYSFNFENIF